MTDMPRAATGGMEGDGAYNRHASVQAAGNTLALLHAREAARRVDINPENEPIIIADYGSSQGKNSLAPMRAAIETLRSRAAPLCGSASEMHLHVTRAVGHVDVRAGVIESMGSKFPAGPRHRGYSKAATDEGRSFTDSNGIRSCRTATAKTSR